MVSHHCRQRVTAKDAPRLALYDRPSGEDVVVFSAAFAPVSHAPPPPPRRRDAPSQGALRQPGVAAAPSKTVRGGIRGHRRFRNQPVASARLSLRGGRRRAVRARRVRQRSGHAARTVAARDDAGACIAPPRPRPASPSLRSQQNVPSVRSERETTKGRQTRARTREAVCRVRVLLRLNARSLEAVDRTGGVAERPRPRAQLALVRLLPQPPRRPPRTRDQTRHRR